MTLRRTLSMSIVLIASTLSAQNNERSLTCENGNRNNSDNDRQRFCEVREFSQPAASRITADGGPNGGVSVKGWNRNEMLVRARVETWAPTEGEARALAGQLNIQTAGGNIRSNAPDFGGGRGWSVSYEIFVPTRTDVSLKARNGGISMSDIQGSLDFDAVNGGVSLKRLAGSVHGKTVNGGLSIELAGTRWEGNELDVSASNGGVSLSVPANYSARLETRTQNGRISTDFPLTVQGQIDRELSTVLGSGGPLIRAVTTNGGVSIKRRS